MKTQNQGGSNKRGATKAVTDSSSKKARIRKNIAQETIGDLLIEVSQL